MRGDDRQPDAVFSYVSMESRIPQDHPLRAMTLPLVRRVANGRPRLGPTVFTKNRERLLAGAVARGFLEQVLAEARAQDASLTTSSSSSSRSSAAR